MIRLREVASYRGCNVCYEKAAAEIIIKSGHNSTMSIAYCRKHLEQFKKDAEAL